MSKETETKPDTTEDSKRRGDSVQRVGMQNRIKWNDAEEKPDPSRECLCKMKHGILTGYYDPDGETFCGYFWRDITFTTKIWCYMDEIDFSA